MSAERDLDRLLAGMSPVADPEVYVFATLGPDQPVPDVPRLMQFSEAEGETLILTRMVANSAGLAHDFPCRRITLNVHSALDAVGFLARITTALAAQGMGVNPVAGFYHDHLFIPEDRFDDAMACLQDMVRDAGG